jgi:hypothetical protein
LPEGYNRKPDDKSNATSSVFDTVEALSWYDCNIESAMLKVDVLRSRAERARARAAAGVKSVFRYTSLFFFFCATVVIHLSFSYKSARTDSSEQTCDSGVKIFAWCAADDAGEQY